MSNARSMVWDLDAIFEGGSASPEFVRILRQSDEEIKMFTGQIKSMDLTSGAEAIPKWESLINLLQSITAQINEADSFISCLNAQDTEDKQAGVLEGQVRELAARFSSALTRLDELLVGLPDSDWSELLRHEPMSSLHFPLQERRELAKDRMNPELESLAADLAVDGYHGWGQLYDTAVSKIKIPSKENGETKLLSAGQAFNKLQSPNREVRQKMFEEWEKAWTAQSDFCADALNHLGGFRLQLYKHRGWPSIHQEPLAVNRMSERTLKVMWETINRNLDPFLAYLSRKAKMMGVERLSWADLDAPTRTSSAEFTFDQAADLIIGQFRRFSPKMADFAEMAFDKRWIEAEDRDGKRPGGFCTSFPLNGSTRIFMTFSGTVDNLSTLAHELGHAFHQHVMKDMPVLKQDYAMNVAETASTFAELLVSDAVIRQAQGDEKIAFLENKVDRSVTFYMNIQARFRFETAYYAARKEGIVPAERLNELMIEAQKACYHDALDLYHPHFWASKLHFYITEVPFYNFPYTFGYLFSAGIYDRAMAEGGSFEERYIDLLRDTGSMTVEELAKKHLNADLTSEEFWQRAVDRTKQDVELYMELTE